MCNINDNPITHLHDITTRIVIWEQEFAGSRDGSVQNGNDEPVLIRVTEDSIKKIERALKMGNL